MRRRSTIVTATTIAAATAAFATLVSCSADPAVPTAAARPASPARELTQAEQARIDQAEERLIQRCMERKGLPYWVDSPVSADTAQAFTHSFVRDDVAWAREHGYGEQLRRAFFAAKKRDRNLAYRKGLSSAERERYVAALAGGRDTPMLSVRLPAGGTIRRLDGGCQHSARTQLYGDTEAYFRADKIATNLARVYSPRLMRAKRFKSSLGAWSDCMRGTTGHRYAAPDAIHADLQKRIKGLDASRAHAIEVKLAVSEATCARKTSLKSALAGLDRKYGDPVRERYAEEITTSNRMKLAALHRANRIDDRG